MHRILATFLLLLSLAAPAYAQEASTQGTESTLEKLYNDCRRKVDVSKQHLQKPVPNNCSGAKDTSELAAKALETLSNEEGACGRYAEMNKALKASEALQQECDKIAAEAEKNAAAIDVNVMSAKLEVSKVRGRACKLLNSCSNRMSKLYAQEAEEARSAESKIQKVDESQQHVDHSQDTDSKCHPISAKNKEVFHAVQTELKRIQKSTVDLRNHLFDKRKNYSDGAQNMIAQDQTAGMICEGMSPEKAVEMMNSAPAAPAEPAGEINYRRRRN